MQSPEPKGVAGIRSSRVQKEGFGRKEVYFEIAGESEKCAITIGCFRVHHENTIRVARHAFGTGSRRTQCENNVREWVQARVGNAVRAIKQSRREHGWDSHTEMASTPTSDCNGQPASFSPRECRARPLARNRRLCVCAWTTSRTAGCQWGRATQIVGGSLGSPNTNRLSLRNTPVALPHAHVRVHVRAGHTVRW